MSAKFVDALKGYEEYLRTRGEAKLDDINRYLQRRGRGQIRQRTYGHYRKLLLHGFRSYIPINQFDVFQTLGKLQLAADRRRYQRTRSDISAYISRDQKAWVTASVADRSDVGFGLTIAGRIRTQPRAGAWVRLLGYEDIPVVVVWKHFDPETGTSRLGVRAFQYVARYRRGPGEPDEARLTGELRITRVSPGKLDWGDAYRVIDKTNELLDAVEALLYSLDDPYEPRLHIARPVLSSIRLGSPGQISIKIDLGIAELLKVVLDTIRYWKLEPERKKLDIRRRSLQNASLELGVLRKALHLGKEAMDLGLPDEVTKALLEPARLVLGINRLPRDTFGNGSPEQGVLQERVLPAAIELAAGDDPGFTVAVSPPRKRRRSSISRRGTEARKPTNRRVRGAGRSN